MTEEKYSAASGTNKEDGSGIFYSDDTDIFTARGFQKAAVSLEFDKIREMLCDCTGVEGAREILGSLSPSVSLAHIREMQKQTTEAKTLAQTKGAPSFGGVKNIKNALERCEKGACLNRAELLMIGRSAFGNPWVFAQVQAALDGREIPALPPLSERMDTAMRQFELAREDKGEHIACLEARKHLAWYLRGVAHSGYYKEQISRLATPEEVRAVAKAIQRDLR